MYGDVSDAKIKWKRLNKQMRSLVYIFLFYLDDDSIFDPLLLASMKWYKRRKKNVRLVILCAVQIEKKSLFCTFEAFLYE